MSRRLTQSPRHWRLHAAATAVSMTVMAWFLAGKPHLAGSPWIALPGFLHLAAALVSLPYAQKAGRRLDRIARPIRKIISGTMLVVLHLVIVTPTAIILRIFRRDPLDRRLRSQQQSNWHPAAPFTDLRRMF